MIRLGIVVPCYNEEQVLRETTRRLLTLLDRLISAGLIAHNSRIYYIDDGSRDGTWSLIKFIAHENSQVGGIKLSRNCGHQSALLAGLYSVPGDAIVSIDSDLQDDVDTIEMMVNECINGADIVYGVRDDRTTDTYFKRETAQVFYRMMGLLGVEAIYNHADFRLMTRRAIEALKGYREVNLFLRGIIPLIGFPSAKVTYTRGARVAGDSKYPLRRMLSLAWEGVTSFSVIPLRIVTVPRHCNLRPHRANELIRHRRSSLYGPSNPRLGFHRVTDLLTGRHTDYVDWYIGRVPWQGLPRNQGQTAIYNRESHQCMTALRIYANPITSSPEHCY
jgi:glycosyltransferase involved in cell wall biosynthesis